MPFFTNKFSPKKSKSRKSVLSLSNEGLEELVLDNRNVKLQLGEHEAHFQNGNWEIASDSNGCISKTNKKLQHKLQEAQEENNLLKLKMQILLNMLTQTTAEKQLQQREINKLRRNETKNI